MGDPLEHYCSSYYDKHGLYNDGFPCPSDQYCCQSDDDGHKMCCPIATTSPQTVDLSRNKPIFELTDKPTSESKSPWLVFYNNYSSLTIATCLAALVLVLVIVVFTILCWGRRNRRGKHSTKRPNGKQTHEKLTAANYRMSSSSSCATSSTTPSPKTATTIDNGGEQLTIICPTIDDERTLSKSAMSHNHHQMNLTQSSFVTNSTKSNNVITDLMIPGNMDDDDDDDDIFEPPPPMPTDFISTTSSNLEFLKSHSLFDSTPLNFYPDHLPPPPYPASVAFDSTLRRTQNVMAMGDYRFSTFMPGAAANVSNFIKNRDFV